MLDSYSVLFVEIEVFSRFSLYSIILTNYTVLSTASNSLSPRYLKNFRIVNWELFILVIILLSTKHASPSVNNVNLPLLIV